MIYTGQKVYDPLTDTYSTGYWVKDSKGYWYPVWNEVKRMENERLESIELLSELRAKYNCFDEKEEPYYRALSLAIASIKESDDCVSRKEEKEGEDD